MTLNKESGDQGSQVKVIIQQMSSRSLHMLNIQSVMTMMTQNRLTKMLMSKTDNLNPQAGNALQCCQKDENVLLELSERQHSSPAATIYVKSNNK